MDKRSFWTRMQEGRAWSPSCLGLGGVLLVMGLAAHAYAYPGVYGFLAAGGANLVLGLLLNRRLRRMAVDGGRDLQDASAEMIPPRDIPPGAPPPSTGLC